MAGATERMRLGTCVTNPGTREPTVTASALATLDELSGGRMDLGIGRGDSARRVLGKPPITMADTEEAIRVIRALVAGEAIDYEGTELSFPWTSGWTLPVWVAGYGPMALAMTGRVADGLILQLADPDLIRWFVAQVREAATRRRSRPGVDPGSRPRRPAHVGDARRRAASGRAGSRRSCRTTSSTSSTSTRASSCRRVADRLRPGPRGLRLPPPRRGRLVERRPSSATR